MCRACCSHYGSITRRMASFDRMKAGTPVRIDRRSVHFDEMEPATGEADYHQFSF